MLTAEMVLVLSASPPDLKLLMVLLGEADGWVGYHHSRVCQLMPKQSSPILEAKFRYCFFWPLLVNHFFIILATLPIITLSASTGALFGLMRHQQPFCKSYNAIFAAHKDTHIILIQDNISEDSK